MNSHPVSNGIRSVLVVAAVSVAFAASSPASPIGLHQLQLGQPHRQRSQLTLTLTATTGELEILLTFPPTDSGDGPITALQLAKGTSQSVIESLTEADFASPPPGVEILALAPTDWSYRDQSVSEAIDYFYKLRGCDSGTLPTCALSNVAKGRAGAVPVTFYLGAEEMVFDAPTEACSTTTGFDVSDVVARAVRRGDGSILLICGNSRGNFFHEGPDFDSLQRNCSTPAPFDSNFENDPALFDYQRWVLSPYRDPASAHPDRIHVLIHHEFHDTVNPPCAPPNILCQYMEIGYAYSDDGGHSYIEPPRPAQLVAALPYPWDPNLKLHGGEFGPWPIGYFLGTNIFRGVDGYTYVFVGAITDPVQPLPDNTYTTLMRTSDIGDPQSWRFWDGSGFGHQTRNPYVNGVSYETAIADPAQYFAAPVDPHLNGISGSITYNTYLQKYMMVTAVGAPGGFPCGFYYALSNDLIHWSVPRIFREGNQFSCDPTRAQDVYPSIIDHQDTSTNFEFADDTFEVYFLHYIAGADRDLVRMPVRIELP